MLLLALLLPAVLAAPFNQGSTPNLELGDLFQGDIILQEGVSEKEVTPLSSVVDRNRLWEDNVVWYSIEDPNYTPEQMADIRAGVQALMDYVAVDGQLCINVVERNGGTDEDNYVRVFDNGGCSSYIGRIGGPQDMSLAPGCISRIGTIMHEFLHALGIYHEQSRGDRDEYVTINFDNIEPGFEGNFVKYVEGVTIDHLGTDYDYTSVMHYPGTAFAIDSSIPTIVTTDPDAQDLIGQRDIMSEVDIERIQVLYGCVSAADTKHFKHLAGKNIFKN